MHHNENQSTSHRHRAVRSRAPGFSLIELLVTVSILALLISVLSFSLARVRASARGVGCKNNLKRVAFEFSQFADNSSHPYRGDSDQSPGKGFYIEDFQERLYGISEFWKGGKSGQNLDPSQQALMCPAAPQQLTRRPGLPCSQYAVTPVQNVSVGFNKRLERASVTLDGFAVLKPVRLTERILDHPSMPVAFDVDGSTAADRRVVPYYAAPAAGGEPGAYSSGQFWFPSRRHGGNTYACFVGGHVLSSRQPEQASGWAWRFQPPSE